MSAAISGVTSIVAAGSGLLSAGAGIYGAVAGANAQDEASQRSLAAQMAATAEQARQYDTTRKMYQPYMQAGYQGLGQLTGQDIIYEDPYTGERKTMPGVGRFDLMKGVGEAPSYEKEYTQKLADYAQSPAYKAQETLNQQALQRQLNARGLNYGATGASAGAELSQKLTASDYDKYRQDLAARYTALKGEFAQKRDINQNQYNQLLDLVKIGQGAASSTGQASNVYSQQVGQAGQNLANIYSQQGAQQAGMWSGLGGVGSSAIGTGLRAYELGQKAGWWGGAKDYTSGMGLQNYTPVDYGGGGVVSGENMYAGDLLA